jgi:xylulokinase
MLDALGLTPAFVPRAYEGPEITGRIHQQASTATGLHVGTPVVAGGGDQAAGAVGNGIVRAGVASATVGTSGVVFAATDQPLVDAAGRIHTFCHSVPNKWHVMGVTQGAGLSLRWFRDQLGADEQRQARQRGTDAYDVLCEEAATTAPGAEGLLFIPYLMGERTPHLDARARGGWIGLTAAHTRAHLIRAVLEGVAYSLKDTFEIFSGLGLHSTEVRLSGGGARGMVWPQIQASIYGVNCVRVANLEGAAYGAALLAMTGTGRFKSVEQACDECVRIEDRIPPERGDTEVYGRGYELYRELYPRLKDVFARMG